LSTNELVVPYGSKSILTLPDGTKLWVNSGSKLSYQSDFAKSNRNIYLEGEAYFEVAKNKKLPFIVHTGNVHIRALGTAFNVKAYPEEKKIETTLVHGLLKIDKKGLKEPIILNPKQKVIIMEEDRMPLAETKVSSTKQEHKPMPKSAAPIPAKILLSASSNTGKEICWTQNKLIFEKEPLESLTVMLSRRYNVHFVLKIKEFGSIYLLGHSTILHLNRYLKPSGFHLL
jgi:ferric-dicitrate binding protein FerR (iron transport regulator)